MLPYSVRLRALSAPLHHPLSHFVPVQRVRARVMQQFDQHIDQHRDRIVEGQRRLDELLDTARRHSEAQSPRIHEPLEQAIDWFDDLQSRLAAQLIPTIVARQSPWCGSVDKRLKGLAKTPAAPALTPRTLQQNMSALLYSQVAQTVARYPSIGPMTDEQYRVMPKPYPQQNMSGSLGRLTRLPAEWRETRERMQRQVDRLVGVRPVQDVWETSFPEDER
ncbi:MAG: hypothetical protein RLY58_250 [Pseudomonadota bacterium]|jgi:hypothetical protein